MAYKDKISQAELAYSYEHAELRMAANPDVTENHRKRIHGFPHFTKEADAIKAAVKLSESAHSPCQVWAKIGKDEEYYYVQDYFIATDDNLVKQSAEYIGMAHIFTA